MTTEEIREKIREGIAERIFEWCKRNGYIIAPFKWEELRGEGRGLILSITDIALEYEAFQGVVIKVDRELPEPISHWDKELTMEEISTLTQLDMEARGYTTVESLIKGE